MITSYKDRPRPTFIYYPLAVNSQSKQKTFSFCDLPGHRFLTDSHYNYKGASRELKCIAAPHESLILQNCYVEKIRRFINLEFHSRHRSRHSSGAKGDAFITNTTPLPPPPLFSSFQTGNLNGLIVCLLRSLILTSPACISISIEKDSGCVNCSVGKTI